MKITLTITILKSEKSFDIQVNGEQKIVDTITILNENLKLGMENIEQMLYIQSKRSKRKINPRYTFEQAHIYSGDHLVL